MNKDISSTVPNILVKFASFMGTELEGRKLVIPDNFGHGYCSGFVFDGNIRMLISNYELNEELKIRM